MRTFNVSFLAVLSCIAMIGATSIGEVPQPEAIAYVALQQLMKVLTRL